MPAAAGYIHAYNHRARPLAVLIVEPRGDLLATTVARYVARCSFAMAVLPSQAASAARMFAFDGVVIPPTVDAATRAELVARFAGGPRVVEDDDPIAAVRELRRARTPSFARLPLRA